MGFFVITPFAALLGWTILSTFRRLQRGNYDTQWWKYFWILTLAGLALGTWLSFFSRYQVANQRMEGFPFPIKISTREKPDGPWMTTPMPVAVRAGGAITNLLAGVALCLAPVAVAAFFKENRPQQDDLAGRPPADQRP